MNEAKLAKPFGLTCPVCRWPARSETRCLTCGWQLRSELILGPPDQAAKDRLARELREKRQEYDLRCAILASSLGTGPDDDRLARLAGLARGGPPRDDVLRRVTKQVVDDRPKPGKRLKAGIDFALVRLVSAQTRGITFLEVSPDGLAVQPLAVDNLGLPVVLSAGPALSWPELFPVLSGADPDQRSFWLAGGVGSGDTLATSELRRTLEDVVAGAFTELIGASEQILSRSAPGNGPTSPVDIVLVSRAHGWAVPDIATRLAHRSGYPVTELFQRQHEESLAAMVSGLADRAPLRYAYELMLVKIESPGDRVELDPRPLFAAGETVQSQRGQEKHFELIPPPYAADVLALPVVARRGTSPEEWARVREVWMSGTGTDPTKLSVRLLGPGKLRIVITPESPARPPGARAWPTILVGRPKKLPKLDRAVDVGFLIELGGKPEVVKRRVQLVRDLVAALEADAGSARTVLAAVFGYREHESHQTSKVMNRSNSLLVGRGMGSTSEVGQILGKEELWEAVPPRNGRVAPLEDALAKLAAEGAWRQDAQHVMCVIGSRPPHPPWEGPHGGFDTPCRNKVEWEPLLGALKVDHHVQCLAVVDEDPAEDTPSEYAAMSWAKLGAKGRFPAAISPQRLAQSVRIAANGAVARIGLAVDLHAHQRSNP